MWANKRHELKKKRQDLKSLIKTKKPKSTKTGSSLPSSSGFQFRSPTPYLPNVTYTDTSAALKAKGSLRLRTPPTVSTPRFRVEIHSLDETQSESNLRQRVPYGYSGAVFKMFMNFADVYTRERTHAQVHAHRHPPENEMKGGRRGLSSHQTFP